MTEQVKLRLTIPVTVNYEVYDGESAFQTNIEDITLTTLTEQEILDRNYDTIVAACWDHLKEGGL